MKTVSIIIPLYNKEKYITDTLFSVDRQITNSLFTIEVVIVDDLSTDNSLNIVRDFKWKNPDILVKILRNESNLGTSASLNKALGQCTGDYIALLDADDVLLRYSIYSRFNALENNPDCDWISGLELRMEADGNLIVGREFVKYKIPNDYVEVINGILTGELFLPTSSLLFRSSIFNKIKWIDEMRSSPEFALCLMTALEKHKLLVLNEYVAVYRYHAEGSPDSLFQVSKSNGQKVKDFTLLKEYLDNKLTEQQSELLVTWIEKWKSEQLQQV